MSEPPCDTVDPTPESATSAVPAGIGGVGSLLAHMERSLGLWLTLLAVVAATIHLSSLGNEILFDDRQLIELSPLATRPWDLAAHFSSGFWGEEHELSIATWRPLVTLTLAWNRALHGVDPAGYRLVNLALHALCCLLLVRLVRRLGGPAHWALAAGFLFATAPVHVEALITGYGRADLMLTAFSLGALLAWLRERHVAGLALLAGALLCKEMAVMVAALLLWSDLAGGRWSWRRAAAVTGVAALWFGGRFAALGCIAGPLPSTLENPLVGTDLATRLWGAGEVAWLAFSRLVCPVTLLHDYSYATLVPPSLPTPSALAGLALLLGSAAAVLWWRRRLPAWSLALALLLGPYLLVSHLGPTLPMLFGERTLYLPSSGLFLLTALALARLPGRALPAALVAVALLVVGGAVRSNLRVDDWRDGESLFLGDLEQAPDNVRMLVNGARVHAAAGRRQPAWELLDRALAVAPELALPQLTGAGLAIAEGRREQARELLNRASRSSPDLALMALTECSYAVRFATSDAQARCEAATTAPLARPFAWTLLGTALDQAGRPAEAERAFRRALELDPNPESDSIFNYAIFLARQGRLEEAEPLLLVAARRTPQRPEVQRALEGLRRLREQR